MSDIKVTPSPDVTGVPVATESIGGRDWQDIKIGVGASGVAVLVEDVDNKRFPVKVEKFDTSFGLPNDAAAGTDVGTFSFIALFKRLLTSVTTLLATNAAMSAKLQDHSKVTTATPVQATCDTTADSLLALNAARKEALLKNLGPSVAYLGKSGVTTATGFEVRVGETFVDDLTTQQWFGITAAGTTTFSVLEL